MSAGAVREGEEAIFRNLRGGADRYPCSGVVRRWDTLRLGPIPLPNLGDSSESSIDGL